jgi:hypothetical protein
MINEYLSKISVLYLVVQVGTAYSTIQAFPERNLNVSETNALFQMPFTQ